MALTESTVNDKIEVVVQGNWSTVQVRTANIISRDGEEISRSFSRRVVMPTDDLTGESSDVAAVCNAVFTQDMKDTYAAHMALGNSNQ